MISDLVRPLVRRARRWQRQRRFRVLFLLAVLGLPWCVVFLQLESGLPSIPTRFGLEWMAVRKGVTPEELLKTEKCLESAGLYTVTATEVTIIQPLVPADDVTWAERDAKVHGNRPRCSVFTYPTYSSVPSFQQPLFATPANPRTIESCHQSNVSSLLEIAKAYFFRRRGIVIKTKEPLRYTCRAVLQKGLKNASSQGRHSFYSVLSNWTFTSNQYSLPPMAFQEPESRSILCEALTPEDKAQLAFCNRKLDNLYRTVLESMVVAPLVPPLTDRICKLRDSTSRRYTRFYSIAPMANGGAFWLNVQYLFIVVIIELVVLDIICTMIWFCLDSLLSLLDDCTRQDIALPAGDALRWLTSASHRLHHHLQELVTEKIITPQQYAQLYVREKTRGRVYIHPLLRRFIVSNGTLDALRLYVTKTDIQIPDGYQTQTSTESDSDDESNAHPLAIIAASQLFNDSSFERLLELKFITSHQFVRIYDTRETRSPYEAARLLIRVVQGNNKGEEFLVWFCEQFHVPEYEQGRIALAVMATTFKKPGVAVRARTFVWKVKLLLAFIFFLVVVQAIFLELDFREAWYFVHGLKARRRVYMDQHGCYCLPVL